MRLTAIALLLLGEAGIARPIPTRKPVESFAISPNKMVAHVEAMRVDFLPGQEMPAHVHSVPVVCFVASGRFAVSVGNSPPHVAAKGDATVEPAGEVVHYFRNLSKTEPASLYCTILAGKDDKQYSVMLNR